ncbi:ATP-binding protein [Paenibacillus tarimensis]
MPSKKKLFIILPIYILAIIGLRLVFFSFQQPIAQPYAVNGTLDLRSFPIPQHQTIALNGEWDFFPSRLLTPEQISNASSSTLNSTAIQVPGSWEHNFADESMNHYRYGTYRLRIKLDDSVNDIFKLRTKEINNAAVVYINGQLAARAGIPAEDTSAYKAHDVPGSILVPAHNGTIDLLIQVGNHAGEGGIAKSIRFGTLEAIDRETQLSIGLQSFLAIVLFLHAFYAIMLYFIGGLNKGLLYFTLMIFCAIASVLVSDDKLLLAWIPMPYEIAIKISLLAYIGVIAFMPPLLKNMFPAYGSTKVVRWFAYYCAAYSLFVLAAPTAYSLPTIRTFLLSVLLLGLIISAYILQKAIRHQEDAIYILISCASLGVNIGWTVFYSRASMEMMHYPFDLMFTVFAFTAFWFKRFFRSVNETKELAEKLYSINQHKDDFLVNTSHELRNPLHGIMNIAQSVLDDKTQPAPAAHRVRLEMQVAVARRMSLLLNDLLDMARLKEQDVRLQTAPVHLQSVIAGSVELISYMLNGKPIRFHVSISEGFPAVEADENRLVQILFNLLHNAVKFTDEGEIQVVASQSDDFARIEVKDTGIGMDVETQRRIFQPYEQGETTMALTYGGFGLGLSICKRLVELHGGGLQVESSPGQGSIFSFTLPLYKGSEEPQQEDPVRSGSLTGGHELQYGHEFPYQQDIAAAYEDTQTETAQYARAVNKPSVLVVDDDNMNLTILRDMLGAEYQVTTAASAADALDQVSRNTYDLLILDVMMPHTTGYELTRIIRERYSVSELPILLLTARSRPEDVITGFQAGANDYVVKPAETWELKSRVRALTRLKLSIEEQLQLEAAWLQAQIQPHFIFNTLNTIAALSTVDIPRMQRLFEQFISYLQGSFDFHNSDKEVPIEHELKLVQNYLYIEQERFGERVHIEWDIDPSLEFSLPPLSIQTLVENAIHHGILQRLQGGQLQITIRRRADHIEVSIRDNGVGMDEETLHGVLSRPDNRSGVGIRNTNRRLKQLYGQGLHIESQPDKGTIVTFQIPV